jgi:hypothetical protein
MVQPLADMLKSIQRFGFVLPTVMHIIHYIRTQECNPVYASFSFTINVIDTVQVNLIQDLVRIRFNLLNYTKFLKKLTFRFNPEFG